MRKFKNNLIQAIKKILATLLGNTVAYTLTNHLFYNWRRPYVIIVTYHDTPYSQRSELRKHMEWYRNNFVNCKIDDLRGLLDDGLWQHNKPGLIISFDDGLRSNFDVALPLLEEFGFTGWLMVPPGFVEESPSKQDSFAKSCLIQFSSDPGIDRIAVSWEELRDIERRGHIVTCHAMNHKRLSNQLSPLELEVEIKDGKKLMESKLGHSMNLFTWVGGEEWAYGRSAFYLMKEVGFNFIFCTNCAPVVAKQSPLFLERYHIEPSYSLSQLRFVLGGFYEFIYTWKRRRIKNDFAL